MRPRHALTVLLATLATACIPPGYYGIGGSSGAAGAAPAATAAGDTSTPTTAGDTSTPTDVAAVAPSPQLAAVGAGQALTQVTTDAENEEHPILSPDGKKLLLSTWENEVVDGQATGNIAARAVVGVDPRSGAGRTVYTSARSLAYAPAWMPDSRSYVCLSNAMGKWNLVRSLSGKPGAALAVVVSEDSAPEMGGVAVAHDGKRVAFHSHIRGVWMIGVAEIGGGGFTQLTEGTNPSWSPDGSRLAFQRDVGGVTQIYTVEAETGDGLVQVTSGDCSSVEPSWSPDGRALVFSSNCGWGRFAEGTAEETWNLYLIEPDGSGLAQLTDGARHATDPSWGSDGWVYFSSDETGGWDIWKVRPVLEPAPAPAPAAHP